MADKFILKDFLSFTFKVIIAHTITYFIFGLLMSNIFDYGELFRQDIIKDYMRPIDSPYILFGPFLQPVRGLLFAIGIWPIRALIIGKKNGWLILWNIIIIFGILSTPSASPSSIEGLIYSKLPLWYHLIGFPELLLQTLTFSLILVWWTKQKSEKQPINQLSKSKKQVTYFVMIIMTACFAYVGYAVGGILSATLSGFQIDLKEASSSVSIKSQLMFVVAFVVNVISIFSLTKPWLKNKIDLTKLFFVFWFIDTSVPLLYQAVFSYMMPLHLAMILGFFPAVVIVVSLYFNRKNLAELDL
ncbi:MAG: hypothetical protein D8M58_19195 [Calditrichaeota bacterium]|nr:MAG: hypothetical protein DWQ03_21875 [Calditrichota bacterium]MBL1207538.1 hypothetical protein [Calditrichota bacterium]NOG47370.1 hypothetical protein [Calditrichota bacterium]